MMKICLKSCFSFDLPQILTVVKNITDDPMLSASELRVEGNTRRLVIEDPRERYTRAEIQNRVYKLDMADRDRDMQRLENLMKLPITPFMKVSESVLLSLPEYFVDDESTVKRCKFTRDNQEIELPKRDSNVNDKSRGAPFTKKTSLYKSLSVTDQSATDESTAEEESPNTLVMETEEGNVTLIVQKSIRGAPQNTAGMVKFRRAMVRYKFVAIKPTAKRVSAVSVSGTVPNGTNDQGNEDKADNDDGDQ